MLVTIFFMIFQEAILGIWWLLPNLWAKATFKCGRNLSDLSYDKNANLSTYPTLRDCS